jgi:EmrB/QacA subfamily drug resistance transporter
MRKRFTVHAAGDYRKRRRALFVLCLGALMIALDATIVNVALPAIRADLRFSEASLVWVVNAYLLTFAGFLLLAGRLGDLFGHRRLFLLGITLFTLASLGCGLTRSQGLLVSARALQGLGGAVVSAAALSLTLNLFTEASERAKAIGVFGFVSAGGGSIASLLGGTLTSVLNWHWIFLINLPVGAAVYALGQVFLPKDGGRTTAGRLDVAGAVAVTTSLMLALYAVVNGSESDRTFARTFALLVSATTLLMGFLGIEARVRTPLMPLRLFRIRNLVVANVAGVLFSAAMYTWNFISTLYLQLVLKYSPLQVGLAFLPANLITAAFSLGLCARIVIRFGIKIPMAIGLVFATAGLTFFALAPVDGNFPVDVLPGMLLLGLGAGMTSSPLMLAAMSDVVPGESGLASGVVTTVFMMGGALGLAILVSVANARTNDLLSADTDPSVALNSGYHIAFFIGAVFTVAAASAGAAFLRTAQQEPAHDRGNNGTEVQVRICDD